MKAGKLAEQLAKHPDADVELMLPKPLSVCGSIFFSNDDGTLKENPQGVFLLAVNLEGHI